MRALSGLAFTLLLASCSSDPPAVVPVDAAADTTPDVTQDTGASDTGRDVIVDNAAPVDAAPDALTAFDAAPDVEPDASIDTAPDVEPIDVPPDAGIDATRDLGAELVDVRPVDTGPSFPSLTTMYSAFEFRVLYRSTCATTPCDNSAIDTVMPPTDCFVDGSGAHFSLQSCIVFGTTSGCATITGLITTGTDAGRGSVALRSVSTIMPRLESGRVYGSAPQRQSFHVQFAIPASTAANGASGIAGRTVSPDFGDVWLLGCPVR